MQRTRDIRASLLAALSCAVLLCLALSTRAYADAVVTNCAAFGPGAGSLQSALSSGPSGGDPLVNEIVFTCSGTILVPEITIGADAALDATGQTVALSGNDTNRVFFVNASLSLIHITVTAGNGALRNDPGWSGCAADE